jgi:glycosyltransferase involved in cell wall biosynthesis
VKRWYYQYFDSSSIAGASALHFTTEQERQKASRLSIPTNTYVVPIPYLVPASIADATDRDRSTLLFIGRLHPVKGLETLLRAFSVVRRQLPSARLVIAGSGESAYERSLHNQVNSLSLDKDVTFVGFVEAEAKERLLNTASALVLPSYQENFGIAAVEAMASGLPVIVTYDVDLWPDVESYHAGLVVKRDVDSLANAMFTILKDPHLRGTMGHNGSKLVRELYNHAAVGRNLLDLYDSVRKRERCVPA